MTTCSERPGGEPVHPDTVFSLMTTLIKRHNGKEPDGVLPHARLHDLRHVHATILAGTQVHVVAARLGHADSSITLRVSAITRGQCPARRGDGHLSPCDEGCRRWSWHLAHAWPGL